MRHRPPLRVAEVSEAQWLEQRSLAGEPQDWTPAAVVQRLRDHLHLLSRIREELEPSFELGEATRGAYLYRWYLPPGALDVEERLIAEGRLPATGARFVGARRP